MTRLRILLIGLALTIGFAGLWHAPLGAGERMAAHAEDITQRTLTKYEMTGVTGRYERGPLARRLSLSGKVDDFQREELVRILNEVPGVLGVYWLDAGGKPPADRGFVLPLAIEAQLFALLGFAIGMIIMYIVELRRRANFYKKRI